ncbi:hypothetical protein GXG07_22335 [Escherichia coli]|nr:hypothetical protein [Escherichia coli]
MTGIEPAMTELCGRCDTGDPMQHHDSYKVYYDRQNKGNNTYRLSVYKEHGRYRLHYEHLEKVASCLPGKANTKRAVFEQEFIVSSLRELDIQFLPFDPISKKFLNFIKENNYEL